MAYKKTGYQIVMDSRKELVDEIIANMEKGYIFSPERWNRNAMRPTNPTNNVKYKGVNKLRLAMSAIDNNYTDNRWLTFQQASNCGYKIKPEERGTLCEKWIWEKEVKKIVNGKEEIEIEPLNKPIVNYFKLFNAQQLEGISKLPEEKEKRTKTNKIIKDFVKSSECPIKQVAQSDAFYSPSDDKIVLPLKSSFKSEIAFLGVLQHEMSHSTGHETRLNRNIINSFGTEDYAKEELRAELSTLFLESDLILDKRLENRQDHINYFSSWIQVLKNDKNELFRACDDSSKIAERLEKNYEIQQELNNAKDLENEM
jgi:antirestriction protein ArdC